MGWTTGVQAASATPAADFVATLDTAMTGGGWTYIGEKTAATMGTTGAVKCYASPSTTESSNVYTGCIVFIEPVEASNLVRFRCAEMFDDAATGSPASNVKRTVPGCAANNSSINPDDSQYTVQEAYTALYQAQAAGQTVGWMNLVIAGAGFAYEIGVNSDLVVAATNANATAYWVIAGHLGSFTLYPAGDTETVFLGGRCSATDICTSWTYTQNNLAAGWRTSRCPYQPAATTGNFCVFPNGPNPLATAGSVTSAHEAFGNQPAMPVFLHGFSTQSPDYNRSFRAYLEGFIMFDAANKVAMGESLTAGGVEYTILGPVQSSNTGSIYIGVGMAVDASIF